SQNMIKLCHNFTFQNMEVLCVIYAPLVFPSIFTELKWKNCNRAKIKNRTGASGKSFTCTLTRNHFLNECLCPTNFGDVRARVTKPPQQLNTSDGALRRIVDSSSCCYSRHVMPVRPTALALSSFTRGLQKISLSSTG
ncbi:unnamed protein product, partial [Nesidiocoris tenuis]